MPSRLPQVTLRARIAKLSDVGLGMSLSGYGVSWYHIDVELHSDSHISAALTFVFSGRPAARPILPADISQRCQLMPFIKKQTV